MLRFGKATTVDVRRSVANAEHDRYKRERAKLALKYPPVVFDGRQARAIGRGFADYVGRSGLPIWACAILPEHVHLVIGRTDQPVEQRVNQLKGAATRQLNAERINPTQGRHPPFARSCWKVFLDRATDIDRAIEYVERNPHREGKPAQRWTCVRMRP